MIEAVIVSTARTAVGKAYRGALNNTEGPTMAGHVIAEAVKRANIAPDEVEDVVMGCAMQQGTMVMNVARKGAIRAGEGDLGIIPGSMATGTYIVRGLGDERAFNSASHGAGRRMSRTRAKKSFTVDDLVEQTRGVECRKDAGVIDEIPGAYKDIESVIEAQLAHAVKDSLGRAYNRTEFRVERFSMMQKWADYLDELRRGADVVKLRAA